MTLSVHKYFQAKKKRPHYMECNAQSLLSVWRQSTLKPCSTASDWLPTGRR